MILLGFVSGMCRMSQRELRVKSDHFLADGAIRLWAGVRYPVLQTAHMAGFTRGREQDSAWHMPTVRETWDHIICSTDMKRSRSWKSSWDCCSDLFFLFCFVLSVGESPYALYYGWVFISLHLHNIICRTTTTRKRDRQKRVFGEM